jgi:hypothetical protein
VLEIALSLGAAVAKSVLSLWVGDVAVLGDVSGLAIDKLVDRVPNLAMLERRKAVRQFERMAESVAEKLDPFLESEFGGLPANEREAAVLAVASAMEKAGITSDLLLSHDLDPARLEAHIRSSSPRQREDLISVAQVLYDQLLRESCTYAVEVAITLPPFTSQAALESLRRETEIIELIHQVLDKIPEASPDPAGRDENDDFETGYRRTVARTLDRLELFGVDVSHYNKRYALSVAYISLNASDPDDKSENYVRVEDALALGNRMLVRGEPGSGKSTLLQWLAVTSARRAFVGGLSDGNGTVPFFIRLRQYVGRSFPNPEEFVGATTPTEAGRMPSGWVHRLLDTGRAMVMVDGVDELPDEEERKRARDWLIALTLAFERARFVVTSRLTIPEDWLREANFRHCQLQRMTDGDMASFVDHWHAAMRTAADSSDDDGAELERLSAALKASLQNRPAVRKLATSPLLCALICALHRQQSNELPNDRMELYRVALYMLLERRDIERRIVVATRIPFEEKKLLLQDLAYWLTLNGYSYTAQAVAIERIAGKLPSLRRIMEEPSEVFRYLLERCGVLRAPVEGQVDFVHRTFQEYFAAAEAVQQDSVGLLVRNAHEEQWREVVILAAGHASLRQREKLLRGLLDRGYKKSADRHRLHLLAIACLETSPELPEALTAELQEILPRLLPPKNMTEAPAVASAGSLAAPLLAQFHSERARTAAACVRALGLIGGEEAMDALAGYGEDTRQMVVEELIRNWPSFHAIAYARRVLAHSPLNEGGLQLEDARLFPALEYLLKLRSLELRDIADHGLQRLPRNTAVRSLTVSATARIADLSFLTQVPNLETLEITAPLEGGSDLAPIAKSVGLRHFALNGGMSVRSLDIFSGLSRLESLSIRPAHAVSDLSPLAGLTALSALHMSASLVRDLSPLAGLRDMTDLRLTSNSITDLGPLADLTRLRYLDLSGTRVADLRPLAKLTQLQYLDLSGSQIADLTPLAGLIQLRHLSLRHSRIREVGPLAGLMHLNTLDIEGTGVEDLTPLGDARRIDNLILRNSHVRQRF